MTIEARKLHLIRRLIDIVDEALLDKMELILNSSANEMAEKDCNKLETEQFLEGYAPEDGVYDKL